MIGPGEIFTLFFITLGPLKVLGPFVQRTAGLDPGALRGIALRVFVFSVVAVAVSGFLGRALALNWKISQPALLIAGAVIFFLVALGMVMEQYQPAHAAPEPLPAKRLAAALELTFPTVVTPYGIAAVIALLSATQDIVREGVIWLAVLGVMVLNLLAMIFARAIMQGPAVLVLRLLGAVLGVLQVALAVQIFLRALQDLGVIAR